VPGVELRSASRHSDISAAQAPTDCPGHSRISARLLPNSLAEDTRMPLEARSVSLRGAQQPSPARAWGKHLSSFKWTHVAHLTYGWDVTPEQAFRDFRQKFIRRVAKSARRPSSGSLSWSEPLRAALSTFTRYLPQLNAFSFNSSSARGEPAAS